MTVWMHKGGFILLRKFKMNKKYWVFSNGTDYVGFGSDYFFRQHCVYIGRF